MLHPEHGPMGSHALWAILLAEGGRELARIILPPPAQRHELPLRDLASEAMQHDATAIIIVRNAADAACAPCAAETRAIDTARATLGAIGLRLHDYILWHGNACVSMRRAGKF